MKAVIELAGQQFLVTEGTRIECNQLLGEEKENIEIKSVLMVDEGESSKIGTPYVANATVTGRVVRHFRGKKVIVFKYKNKTNYRRKNGHRQDKTELVIEKISA